MKRIINAFLILVISIINLNCSSQKRVAFKHKVIYNSADLIITQIANNSFVHTSYLQTNDFGNVPCNGLIVRNSDETIVFDTPTNNKSAEVLIKWIKETLHCKINAVIPTHFHDDCLGGLNAFDENKISSYAYFKTIELAKANNYVVPKNSFNDSLILKVGDEKILVKFLGEGHASKGYLGDANISAWSNTVENVKKEYPNVKIVVPGHGAFGNKKLLDYTIKLFKIH